MSSNAITDILNLLVVPWDTSDLPPNVRVMSPSLKIVEAQQALYEAVKSCVPQPGVHNAYSFREHVLTNLAKQFGMGNLDEPKATNSQPQLADNPDEEENGGLTDYDMTGIDPNDTELL